MQSLRLLDQVKDVSFAQATEHQSDHADVHEAFRGFAERFVVFCHPPVSADPSERALDDPPLGKNDKAFHIVGALDDLQLKAELFPEFVDEFALIGPVRDHRFKLR